MRVLATTVLVGLFASTVPQAPAAAAPPVNYYAAAQGKHGAALKDALHDIISTNVTVFKYPKVWDILKDTDRDPAKPGNVICIYSRKSIPWSQHGPDDTDWNREHVWAKSHGNFGIDPGAGTDVHHLRPSKVPINRERSNLDFDESDGPAKTEPRSGIDRDSWEPREEVKGDIARMIFYMAVRYEGGDGGPDLEPDNRTIIRSTEPRHGRISTLLTWNDADPPDASEMRRNDAIFEHWQHNRNPFIDHPEWVDDIYG
ncbi:extracellular ribonuclease [Actinoplanes cyaneus]|uniref:Extracellular ribonuclease n=1 Tax=Actinoplanes cyaneus TaxID=52696 RepID=A0A919M4P7_9ACTN|nr:Endonuclease I [Actinoplanes cyaneus]GID69605.1 extracellular ribonuclease [Actinoplanes cyaneus]